MKAVELLVVCCCLAGITANATTQDVKWTQKTCDSGKSEVFKDAYDHQTSWEAYLDQETKKTAKENLAVLRPMLPSIEGVINRVDEVANGCLDILGDEDYGFLDDMHVIAKGIKFDIDCTISYQRAEAFFTTIESLKGSKDEHDRSRIYYHTVTINSIWKKMEKDSCIGKAFDLSELNFESRLKEADNYLERTRKVKP